MKKFSLWSRSSLEPPFLPGAGADPIWSEPKPESAPGPRDFRSRPKKWRLRNTDIYHQRAVLDEIITLSGFITFFFIKFGAPTKKGPPRQQSLQAM